MQNKVNKVCMLLKVALYLTHKPTTNNNMKTRNEKLEQFLSELKTEVDILSLVDLYNVTDFESLREEIEGSNGFDIEIIYYATAMEYLTENDTSLNESLSLAAELGYTPENLNSEVLASLLASQDARVEFEELEGEITDFFEELETYVANLELLNEKEEELTDLQREDPTEENLDSISDLEVDINDLKTELED